MKQVSLANIDYDDALGLLQLRKEALAAGEARPASSEKLASSYFLRDLGDQVLDELEQSSEKTAMNAIPRNALIGGGIGALAGAGKSLFSDDEDENENWASNALLGGLGGATLGGGLTTIFSPTARKDLTNWFNNATKPGPQNRQNMSPGEIGKKLYESGDAGRVLQTQQAASTWAPEYGLGAGLGIAATPAGYVARKPGRVDLDRNFLEVMKVTGFKPESKDGETLALAKKLKQLYPHLSSFDAALEKVENEVANNNKSVMDVFGMKNRGQLRTLLEGQDSTSVNHVLDYGESIAKNLRQRNLKNIPRLRGGIGAALAGAGLLYSMFSTLPNYFKARENRNRAAEIMDAFNQLDSNRGWPNSTP